MINNYICKDCIHLGLCKVNDKIVVFEDNGKKSLGVNILVQKCENFKEVE